MIVLTTIYVIVAVLLLFGAAIFVHEWGHFFVARKCGMKVEEFAIGFGKILWKREKDGILYTVRMIPAGGFVKLPQMLTSEALEGKSEEEEEEAEPLPDISPWAKIAVAVAGPIMNVVFAFVLAGIIYFVGLPKAITPPIVGALDEQSPEYAQGIRAGDVITSIDGKPIQSWEETFKLTALSVTDRFEVTFERKVEDAAEELTHVLTAKPISEEIALKRLQLPPKYPPVVGKVSDEGAASEAGLKAGDKILSLGGIPVGSSSQLIDELQKQNLVVKQVVEGQPASDAGLQVGDRILSLGGVAVTFQKQLNEELQKRTLTVGQLLEGQPASAAGVKQGDRIISLDGIAIRDDRHFQEELQQHGAVETELVVVRGGESVGLSVTPARVGNQTTIGIGFAPLYAGRETEVVVRRGEEELTLPVTPGKFTSERQHGFWDRIVQAFAGLFGSDEEPVLEQYRVMIGAQFNPVHGDRETEMVVLRPTFDADTGTLLSEEQLTLPITPRLLKTGSVMIGIRFAREPQVYIVQNPGPTPWENISEVGSLMWRTLYALFHKEQTGVGVSDLSGPVGILAMIGAMVKIDYRLALNFLVLLNVNLAILNMLPIPVLDGGHTVMGLIEGLFRRKIPVKLQEWATTGFAVALISLMLYVTFHDVFGRSDVFVDMYNNEVEIKGPAEPGPATSE